MYKFSSDVPTKRQKFVVRNEKRVSIKSLGVRLAILTNVESTAEHLRIRGDVGCALRDTNDSERRGQFNTSDLHPLKGDGVELTCVLCVKFKTLRLKNLRLYQFKRRAL